MGRSADGKRTSSRACLLSDFVQWTRFCQDAVPSPGAFRQEGLFLPVTTSMMHTVSSTVTMAMAQFRKNASGRIRITGSVTGSKSQLSLPGKKMLWNTVKAPSKFSAASRAISRNSPPSPQAAQKPGVRPPNRGSRYRRRRHTTAPVSSSPAAATNTHTTSRNSPRTSAKWPAPSAEKGSTPAEKSGLRPMQ